MISSARHPLIGLGWGDHLGERIRRGASKLVIRLGLIPLVYRVPWETTATGRSKRLASRRSLGLARLTLQTSGRLSWKSRIRSGIHGCHSGYRTNKRFGAGDAFDRICYNGMVYLWHLGSDLWIERLNRSGKTSGSLCERRAMIRILNLDQISPGHGLSHSLRFLLAFGICRCITHCATHRRTRRILLLSLALFGLFDILSALPLIFISVDFFALIIDYLNAFGCTTGLCRGAANVRCST